MNSFPVHAKYAAELDAKGEKVFDLLRTKESLKPILLNFSYHKTLEALFSSPITHYCEYEDYVSKLLSASDCPEEDKKGLLEFIASVKDFREKHVDKK